MRDILDEFSEKSYSNLATLGAVLPALQKQGFLKSSHINIDLRNAINHGNVVVKGKEVFFSYKKGQNHVTQSLKIWEYDDKLHNILDIGSGMLAGFSKFFIENSYFFKLLLSQKLSENIQFEWIKLFYRTTSTRILFLDKALIGLSLPPKFRQKTPAKLRSIKDVKYLEYGDINEPDKRNKKNI